MLAMALGGLALAVAGAALSQGTAAVRGGAIARKIDRLAVEQARGDLSEQAQRQRLAALGKQEAGLAADLGRRRGELSKLLGVLAIFRRNPPPALLVSPDQARDAVRGAILARALTPELTRRAHALSAQLQQIAVLRRQAAAANAAVFAAQSEQAERAAQIADALQEQARAKGLREAPGTPDGGLGPLSEGGDGSALRLAWPVEGEVTRRFGEATPAGGRARGLTITAARGAQVDSPAAGVAEFVGAVPGWGVVLILKIKGAYHLVLGGFQEVTVQNGQSVAAGGAVGRLPGGAKSRPELYVEVRENGAAVDPARWMPGAPLGAPQ